MSNSKPLSPPDIIKLFDFFDSDTPKALGWSHRYLAGKGIQLSNPAISSQQVKIELATYLSARTVQPGEIKQLARAMGDAWRVRKHRQSKGISTVSLSLAKATADKLTSMSKGTTKSETISMLIEGGYSDFLRHQAALQKHKEEQKQIAKIKRQRDNIDKLRLMTASKSEDRSDEISQLIALNEELKIQMAELYDLIFNSNEQDRAIDEKTLLRATKLYFACFNK
ncbi:hypothetical protein [Shewanella sp. GXUN23E]|uniref:hypothetical protein n=1 Tax=Shewanella sp. GXUN23E TaxID=3422498 RepID=UPI003D7DD9A6